MKVLAKTALGAWMLAGALLSAAPASAQVGIDFGWNGADYAFGDPCDYYDYYDAAPPWGLPPDYCDYPVYFEPVFFDGYWYRGPIYYRWNHGHRLFWLHGGWRSDEWHGPRPANIQWRHRGGWNHGLRPGIGVRGGIRGGFRGGVGHARPAAGNDGFLPHSGEHRELPQRSWSGGNGFHGEQGSFAHPSFGNDGFRGGTRGGIGSSHGGFGGHGHP